jgi:hypothetical protein
MYISPMQQRYVYNHIPSYAMTIELQLYTFTYTYKYLHFLLYKQVVDSGNNDKKTKILKGKSGLRSVVSHGLKDDSISNYSKLKNNYNLNLKNNDNNEKIKEQIYEKIHEKKNEKSVTDIPSNKNVRNSIPHFDRTEKSEEV